MFEDPLLLARLQFALTASTHYIFVALTLGLAPFILFGQLRATLRGDEALMLGGRFWGGLYLVNYGMGVLSGLVMELQLATNWSGLGDMFGYAFGAPLAVETMAAFFIESTFLGLWIFGWDRMGRWSHLACFAVVAATAYASAYWVLVANGFLKNPVGFEIRGGVAVLTDPRALLANPAALLAFGHIVAGALLLGGLVVAAVSAYHLARGNDPGGMYRRGITSGVTVAALALLPVAAFGGTQYAMFGQEPPTSGRTLSGTEIAGIEESYNGAAAEAFGVAGHLLMLLCWTAMVGVAAVGLFLWLIRRLHRWRWFHWILVFCPFLPTPRAWAGGCSGRPGASRGRSSTT